MCLLYVGIRTLHARIAPYKNIQHSIGPHNNILLWWVFLFPRLLCDYLGARNFMIENKYVYLVTQQKRDTLTNPLILKRTRRCSMCNVNAYRIFFKIIFPSQLSWLSSFCQIENNHGDSNWNSRWKLFFRCPPPITLVFRYVSEDRKIINRTCFFIFTRLHI